MDLEKMYAVLWSGSQRCVHVDRLDEMIEKNREGLAEDLKDPGRGSAGYSTVGLFATLDEAKRFAAQVQERRDESDRRHGIRSMFELPDEAEAAA